MTYRRSGGRSRTSSQPHDKPIRVAPQKAIIIKVLKTAPGGGAEPSQNWGHSYFALPPYSRAFLFGFGHFFDGSGALVRASRKRLIGFRIGAGLICEVRSAAGTTTERRVPPLASGGARAWECGTEHVRALRSSAAGGAASRESRPSAVCGVRTVTRTPHSIASTCHCLAANRDVTLLP